MLNKEDKNNAGYAIFVKNDESEWNDNTGSQSSLTQIGNAMQLSKVCPNQQSVFITMRYA